MAQRSIPYWKAAARTFPVQVKFVLPSCGYGVGLTDMYAWLNEHAGRGNYLWHASTLYIRDLDVVARFIETFPWLKLDDRTVSQA